MWVGKAALLRRREQISRAAALPYGSANLTSPQLKWECSLSATDKLHGSPVIPALKNGQAQLREQPDGGLLDKLLFGVGVGHEVKRECHRRPGALLAVWLGELSPVAVSVLPPALLERLAAP